MQTLCRRWSSYPSNLCFQFTTATVDNIDRTPSSKTAHNSFYGTEISLFQHPSEECPGITRANIRISNSISDSSKSDQPLPHKYTDLPAVLEFSPNIKVPEVSTTIQPNQNLSVAGCIQREELWLQISVNSLN